MEQQLTTEHIQHDAPPPSQPPPSSTHQTVANQLSAEITLANSTNNKLVLKRDQAQIINYPNHATQTETKKPPSQLQQQARATTPTKSISSSLEDLDYYEASTPLAIQQRRQLAQIGTSNNGEVTNIDPMGYCNQQHQHQQQQHQQQSHSHVSAAGASQSDYYSSPETVESPLTTSVNLSNGCSSTSTQAAADWQMATRAIQAASNSQSPQLMAPASTDPTSGHLAPMANQQRAQFHHHHHHNQTHYVSPAHHQHLSHHQTQQQQQQQQQQQVASVAVAAATSPSQSISPYQAGYGTSPVLSNGYHNHHHHHHPHHHDQLQPIQPLAYEALSYGEAPHPAAARIPAQHQHQQPPLKQAPNQHLHPYGHQGGSNQMQHPYASAHQLDASHHLEHPQHHHQQHAQANLLQHQQHYNTKHPQNNNHNPNHQNNNNHHHQLHHHQQHPQLQQQHQQHQITYMAHHHHHQQQHLAASGVQLSPPLATAPEHAPLYNLLQPTRQPQPQPNHVGQHAATNYYQSRSQLDMNLSSAGQLQQQQQQQHAHHNHQTNQQHPLQHYQHHYQSSQQLHRPPGMLTTSRVDAIPAAAAAAALNMRHSPMVTPPRMDTGGVLARPSSIETSPRSADKIAERLKKAESPLNKLHLQCANLLDEQQQQQQRISNILSKDGIDLSANNNDNNISTTATTTTSSTPTGSTLGCLITTTNATTPSATTLTRNGDNSLNNDNGISTTATTTTIGNNIISSINNGSINDGNNNNNNNSNNGNGNNNVGGRSKRLRTSFKHNQLKEMKRYFATNQNPDANNLKTLAQTTGLSKRVLQVWFQNARAKHRRNSARLANQQLFNVVNHHSHTMLPRHHQQAPLQTYQQQHHDPTQHHQN